MEKKYNPTSKTSKVLKIRLKSTWYLFTRTNMYKAAQKSPWMYYTFMFRYIFWHKKRKVQKTREN